MAYGTAVVWPKLAGPPQDRWLWSRRVDLFWITGGGFFLFVLAALPLSFLPQSGVLLTALFLHLGIVCNYPHYAATYQVIVRERAARPRPFRTLLWSTPVMLAMMGVVAWQPDLLWGLVVRLYLCWSAHHYAAQNFGISAMYAARGGKPLEGREKSLLQLAFLGLGVFFIITSNTVGGDPESAARVVGLAKDGGTIPIANLPAIAYPIALALAVVCAGAFLAADRLRRARTGAALDAGTWVLFVTTIAWFVVPNIRVPGTGEPWMWPGLRLALLGAPPFFHCAQYLAVCGHRDRQSGDVRPIVVFAALVFGGYALFTAPPHAVQAVFAIDRLRALLLVVAAINLHHFWLDGVMWKRPKRAVAPAPQPAPAVMPSA